jgi:hypothetical protein
MGDSLSAVPLSSVMPNKNALRLGSGKVVYKTLAPQQTKAPTRHSESGKRSYYQRKHNNYLF